jgi:hypothetical protein
MRQKLFTQGVTVFFQPEMYQQLKKESDEQKVGMSEMIRHAVYCFLDRIEELKQKELEEQRQRDLERERIPEQED